jgi:hypothetical protein
VDQNRYLVDYVYGPYVGRTYVEGPTLKEAGDKLWEQLGRELWVAKRFRTIKEVKGGGS